MRKLLLAALGALLCATPGGAQLPHLMPAGSLWIDVNYPKLFWTPTEGLTAGGYLAFIRQLSLDNADAPPPYAGSVALNGQISTSGSRELTLEGRFPALAPGWRIVGTLDASRAARANYVGIGNATVYDGDLATGAQEHFYQAVETRWVARGEIQRRLTGGLRALAGFHAERWGMGTLTGPSVLATDLAGGADPTLGRNTTDLTVRGGLVFDTRDDEPAANRGVLLEAIHALSAGGDLDYSRTTVSASGYVPVGEQLVLSARALAQGMGGTPRVGSYHLIEASDRPFTGLGGALSHRALMANRFLGRDKILLNLDARYHVVNLPRAARASILVFFDAGRVFEGEPFKLTTTDLKVGGGIGLFAQLGRAGIIGTTAGVGPDGVVFDFATRWIY